MNFNEIAVDILNDSENILDKFKDALDDVDIAIAQGECSKQTDRHAAAIRTVCHDLFPNGNDFHHMLIEAAIVKQRTINFNK